MATNALVKQLTTEAAVSNNPRAKISQLVVEVLDPTIVNAQVSQLAVETVVANPPRARVSQLVVEVLDPVLVHAEISQLYSEVVFSTAPSSDPVPFIELYKYNQTAVTASTSIIPTASDSFFNPTTMGHTGYAYDGSLYNSGVRNQPPQWASWATEENGYFRGSSPSFPLQAVALLTEASLVILDTTSPEMIPWMIFVLQDQGAVPNNFTAFRTWGFKPVALSYNRGTLLIRYASDAGATLQSTMMVTVDFVNDNSYLEIAY